MKYRTLIIFLFCFAALSGQYLPPEEDEEKKPRRRKDKDSYDTEVSSMGNFFKRSTLWGDVDLFWSGNTFNFGIGPKLGYRLTENFMIGPGIRYIFVRNNFYNLNLNVLGGSFFASWKPFEKYGFVLHLEYERLKAETVVTNPNPLPGQPPSVVVDETNPNLLFAGLGLKQSISDRFFYKYLILYDLLGDFNAPYASIIPLTTATRRHTLIVRICFGFDF